MVDFNKLITVKDYCKKFQWPTEKGWRWMIVNMQKNGMKDIFIRLPGSSSVLIDLEKFEKHVESGRGRAPTESGRTKSNIERYQEKRK